jgi:NADH dehydrogenase FAD-containing subunit
MSDFSSADLDAINRAIASGTLTVRFSTPGGADRSITYRSLDELLAIKRQILESIGSTPARSRQSLLVGRKSGC